MARKKTDPDEQLEQEIGNAFVDAGIMAPTEDMPGNDSVVAEVAQDAAVAKPETKDGPDADLRKQFNKSEKWIKRITRANDTFKELNAEVAQRDSEVKAAKGRLASAIEDRDAAGSELSKMIDDHKAGQDYLFDDQPEPQPEVSGTADNWPISELGAKQLGKLLGESLMTASKDRDEPLGLTGPQLEKFESEGVTTIGDLEKRMTDKPHDWWSFLAKKADAAIVNRVLNSWREFRMKCPVSQEPEHAQEHTPTVLEKLAAQNAAPMPVGESADLDGTLAEFTGASA